MTLALMHRRLAVAMGLAALAAFAAGEGMTLPVLLSAAGLGVALLWQPSPEGSAWVERVSRVGILGLCAWMLYVAFVLVGDFMPAVLAMLLFLLVTECLRGLEARNDMRLYSLSFALLIAATAYYPGITFAVAFVAYVALATLGMMVGFLRRQSETFHVPEIRVGRPFLVATVALSGVTVLMSVALFVVFPRLPRQWNVQGRAGAGQVMAGFGDEVSLGQHGGSISPNPEVAFRVEFPDGRPAGVEGLHWRGRSFDHFDGERWARSPGLPRSTPTGADYRAAWGGPFVRQRIFGGPTGARVLFGLHPLVDVQARSAIRVWQDPAGDVVFRGSDTPVYTVTSAAGAPPEERLRASPDIPAPPGTPYLQLSAASPRLRRLADSLTAGLPTRLDRARAVEQWLRGEFGYTLDLPTTASDATLEGFLFRRREGHCEYFATAMAVLLRHAGIPTRSVTGFLGGEWNERGDYLAVTGNDAHAWTEVWFPNVGWVAFDPTPPESRLSALRSRDADGWTWGMRFWLDGVEHQWYKWVLDYNLEKQLGVFRGVGEMFSRARGMGGERGATGETGAPAGPALPWVVAAAAVAALLWWTRRRRPAPLRPEARSYRALRHAYARAGWSPAGAETPAAWAAALSAEGAPGADAAGRAVALYLRARFGREGLSVDERGEMETDAAIARAALRAAGRRRRPRETAGV